MEGSEKRTRLITTVITRIPLSPGQVSLFKALVEADDRWISISELEYRIHESVGGVLGALGNRINQTKGISPPFDGTGLVMTWETFHGEWHYRIRPELNEVINRFPVLQNAMELPVDEIHKKYAGGLQL